MSTGLCQDFPYSASWTESVGAVGVENVWYDTRRIAALLFSDDVGCLGWWEEPGLTFYQSDLNPHLWPWAVGSHQINDIIFKSRGKQIPLLMEAGLNLRYRMRSSDPEVTCKIVELLPRRMPSGLGEEGPWISREFQTFWQCFPATPGGSWGMPGQMICNHSSEVWVFLRVFTQLVMPGKCSKGSQEAS